MFVLVFRIIYRTDEKKNNREETANAERNSQKSLFPLLLYHNFLISRLGLIQWLLCLRAVMLLDVICCVYWVIGIGLYILKLLSTEFDAATSFGKLQPASQQHTSTRLYGLHGTLWKSTYAVGVGSSAVMLLVGEVRSHILFERCVVIVFLTRAAVVVQCDVALCDIWGRSSSPRRNSKYSAGTVVSGTLLTAII